MSPWAAENESCDVFHRNVEFERQEVTEAGAVQNASHAADLVRGQARELLERPDHRVERVGDADHERVGRVGGDAFADGFHDLEVDAQKVIAAHAGLARHTGCDDADIGACDIGVILCAFQFGIKPFGRAGFGDVESLALGGAFGDVEENDVTQLFECHEVGKGATDLSRADEGNLGSGHGICLRSVLNLRCASPDLGYFASAAETHVLAGRLGRVAICQ